jgi:type VI secretion system protein ImpF
MTARQSFERNAPDLIRYQSDSLRVARDRLQPALLDRLTDNYPQTPLDPQGEMLLTHTALRKAVLRDLRWLLNTVNVESSQDLGSFENIRSSTLNYGICALAGKRMSEIDWVDLENAIAGAIRQFEPRILPDSIMVRCVSDTSILEHHNIVSFKIKGMLWCVPYPQEFMFRTDIDLESGHMDLSDMGRL